MPIPYSEIVNQDFQAGAGFVQSLANRVRKAYCQNSQNIDDMEDAAGFAFDPFRPARNLVRQYVCELPEEPIPVFPDRPFLPGAPEGCQCDRMKVTFTRNDPTDGFQDTQVRYFRGKFKVHRELTVLPGGEKRAYIGFLHHGSNGGECLTEPIFQSFFDLVDPRCWIEVIKSEPDPNFPAPEPCQRPVFPPRSPRTPTDRPPFTIDLPNAPGLPDISIPVHLPPVTIAPNVQFEPTLNFDVGGINLEFSLGGVNITFNPTVVAPVTVAPVFVLPVLPPLVLPVGGGGGSCNLQPVLSAIAVVQATVNSIVAKLAELDVSLELLLKITNETIIPLLQDIQECACLPESRQRSTFANLQTYTDTGTTTELTFAQVNINQGGIVQKQFNVPGGVEVSICGWYAFGRTGRWGQRYPLQYLNNLCIPDARGYTQFTYSVYTGLTASGTVHEQKP